MVKVGRHDRLDEQPRRREHFCSRGIDLAIEGQDAAEGALRIAIECLLHGLGFAGALTEIGLPQGDVPLALLSFNVGVELGQLSFVAAVLAAYFLMMRVPLPGCVIQYARPAAYYAIGTLSAFWFFDRLSGFWF